MAAHKYGLFALRPTEKSIRAAEQRRFHCIVPGHYALVYTNDPPEGAVPVGGDELHRLSASELEWLLCCGDRLTAEWLEENETSIADTMGSFLTGFRKELEAEREKQEGGIADGTEE